MIAVIMAADDSKARMRDAITLLNYGFGKCQKYQEDTVKKIQDVPVKCDRCRFICDKEKYEIKRECDSTGQTGG